MQGATLRPLALLAFVSVLLFAGCGGGGDSTSTAVAPETTASVPPPPPPGPKEPKQDEKAPAAKTTPAKKPQGFAPGDSTSLPNEGTKAVAPGVPTTKHGDNSIQHYGVEGASDERVEAASAVQAYLDAQVAGDWSKACSYLFGEISEHLVTLLRKTATPEAPTCPNAMKAFVGSVPKGTLRTVADLHVLSMRVAGDRGFLIFEDGEATPSEIPLEREAGNWKVRALIANVLLH